MEKIKGTFLIDRKYNIKWNIASLLKPYIKLGYTKKNKMIASTDFCDPNFIQMNMVFTYKLTWYCDSLDRIQGIVVKLSRSLEIVLHDKN